MEKAYVSRETLSATDKEDLKRVAVALADAAREAILPLFRSPPDGSRVGYRLEALESASIATCTPATTSPPSMTP
jgi:hypothetical protein